MGKGFQTARCTLYKMSTAGCVFPINQPRAMSFIGRNGLHLLAEVNTDALVKQLSESPWTQRALARGVPSATVF